MAEPGLALHKALLAHLGSLEVDSASIPVYDAVPQGAAMPYVTVDFSISSRADHLVERRDERLVYFNVWSEQRGQAEVLKILGALDALLHRADLTLDTGHAAYTLVESKSTRRDTDNVTFMGRLTLRVMSEH